jgi:hypothetical protein
LNGLVGVMIGRLKPTTGTVFDVGLVMDAVVGQGTAEPFEHDHGDREAWCHGINVTSISGE